MAALSASESCSKKKQYLPVYGGCGSGFFLNGHIFVLQLHSHATEPYEWILFGELANQMIVILSSHFLLNLPALSVSRIFP